MRQVLIVRLYQLVSLEFVKSQNQVPVIVADSSQNILTSPLCNLLLCDIFILYLNIWSDFIFDSELVKLIWDPISSASIWQRLHFDWIVLCFWLIVIFQGKTFQLHASIIWMLPLVCDLIQFSWTFVSDQNFDWLAKNDGGSGCQEEGYQVYYLVIHSRVRR